jgi:hypothetical protein
MDNRKVASEIEVDVLNGVYDNFEILKRKLSHIASKLRESYMVINSRKELTPGEIKTLHEQGYI